MYMGGVLLNLNEERQGALRARPVCIDPSYHYIEAVRISQLTAWVVPPFKTTSWDTPPEGAGVKKLSGVIYFPMKQY